MEAIRKRLGIALAASLVAVNARADAPPCVARCTTPLVEGIVRTVSLPDGRITLRHGPIENLGIPAMTMVFRVKDARWIDGVEIGSSVRFAADRVEGVFTIIHLERRQ